MGFLKSFFQNVFREGTAEVGHASSFERLSEEQLAAHLSVARYGDFLLTEAVRPSYDLKVTPRQGFRHDFYRDEDGAEAPVLMAAASKEILFELFMEMLDPLGCEVDVVLETSHHRQGTGHVDLYREQIDLAVLKSILWDYEDLLVNDGCAGLAVLNPQRPQEVQFDEHKLLIVYGEPLSPFEEILRSHGIKCDENMRFITEAEHVHSSTEQYYRVFEQLQFRLGIDGAYE
jgi:hypothetical protein